MMIYIDAVAAAAANPFVWVSFQLKIKRELNVISSGILRLT